MYLRDGDRYPDLREEGRGGVYQIILRISHPDTQIPFNEFKSRLLNCLHHAVSLISDLKLPSVDEDPVKFEQDRQARRHFAKGLVPTFEKAELVVQLTTLYHEEGDAVKAALACDTLEKAEAFLTPECELCTNTVRLRDVRQENHEIMRIRARSNLIVTHRQVVEMPSCEHRCCQQCAGNYFTIAIKDKSVNEAYCPFCQAPKDVLADDAKDDEASEYFAKLDGILRKAVAEDVYDLFQRKLRDRALMRDPNFKWCYKVGIKTDAKEEKLMKNNPQIFCSAHPVSLRTCGTSGSSVRSAGQSHAQNASNR